jgi:hypothetical protein
VPSFEIQAKSLAAYSRRFTSAACWLRLESQRALEPAGYVRLSVHGAHPARRQSGIRKALEDLQPGRQAHNPRELVSILVDLEAVVDLTDWASSPISPEAPFLTGSNPEDLEACRALADALRAQGYVGLLVPSAAASNEKNLIIYIDGLAGKINIYEGDEQLPLEPG